MARRCVAVCHFTSAVSLKDSTPVTSHPLRGMVQILTVSFSGCVHMSGCTQKFGFHSKAALLLTIGKKHIMKCNVRI